MAFLVQAHLRSCRFAEQRLSKFSDTHFNSRSLAKSQPFPLLSPPIWMQSLPRKYSVSCAKSSVSAYRLEGKEDLFCCTVARVSVPKAPRRQQTPNAFRGLSFIGDPQRRKQYFLPRRCRTTPFSGTQMLGGKRIYPECEDCDLLCRSR